MAIWQKTGNLVVDALGKVIECATCPCTTTCSSCSQFQDFIDNYTEVEVVYDYKDGFFGTNCDPLDGTYLLEYVADVTAIDNAGGTLANQDRVWAYELPTPYDFPLNNSVTHMLFYAFCDSSSKYFAAGFRYDQNGVIVISPFWVWDFTLGGSPNPCDTSGTLAPNGIVVPCEGDGNLTYDFTP